MQCLLSSVLGGLVKAVPRFPVSVMGDATAGIFGKQGFLAARREARHPNLSHCNLRVERCLLLDIPSGSSTSLAPEL